MKEVKRMEQTTSETSIKEAKASLYSLTFSELKKWLASVSEPAFRAKQIYDWLYVKRVTEIDEMTNLSKDLRQKLANGFTLTSLRLVKKQTSNDGTIKFLFELHDGYSIETVIMRHDYGNSVCVTTQVGCRIGCTFCASTLGGKKRDLAAGEIVAQVVEAERAMNEEGERISSCVVMGIGEPFDNYEALLSFLRTINDENGLNIGARHITVSTSGIIPSIYKFADEGMQINFAISLHAPNDELRSRLMPINRAYPLEKLMEAVRYYIDKTSRRVTFEYGLFGGVNDQAEHAEQLADLIKGLKCHVNLIPVNNVLERDYVRTPRKQIFDFERILKKHGVNVTIRREHGSDIDAACGQLRAKERANETR